MQLSPVVLFVYNRPAHTQATLEALRKDPLAKDSELFVFSDGPKHPDAAPQVEAVRAVVKATTGFRQLHFIPSEANQGLSKAIVSGVSQVLAAHGRAIVLEDDLTIVPGFLGFLNAALAAYERNPKIFAISGWAPRIEMPAGFSEEVYLSARALCWGWATWRDRWEKVDWDVKDYAAFTADKTAQKAFATGGDDLPDMLRHSITGRVSSWAIRWAYAQFRLGSWSLVPVRSYVDNIGQDDSGTHSKAKYQFPPAELAKAGSQPRLPAQLEPQARLLESFAKVYAYNWKAKIRKFLGQL